MHVDPPGLPSPPVEAAGSCPDDAMLEQHPPLSPSCFLSPLLRLPAELLNAIFTFVGSPQNLVLTCHRWHAVGTRKTTRIAWLSAQYPMFPALECYASQFGLYVSETGAHVQIREALLAGPGARPCSSGDSFPYRILTDDLMRRVIAARINGGKMFTQVPSVSTATDEQIGEEVSAARNALAFTQPYPSPNMGGRPLATNPDNVLATDSEAPASYHALARMAAARGLEDSLALLLAYSLSYHPTSLQNSLASFLTFALAANQHGSTRILLGEALYRGFPSHHQLPLGGSATHCLLTHAVTGPRPLDASLLAMLLRRVLPTPLAAGSHVEMSQIIPPISSTLHAHLTHPHAQPNPDIICTILRHTNAHPAHLNLQLSRLSERASDALVRALIVPRRDLATGQVVRIMTPDDPFVTFALLPAILRADHVVSLQSLVAPVAVLGDEALQGIDPRIDSDWPLRLAARSGSTRCVHHLVHALRVQPSALVVREAAAAAAGESTRVLAALLAPAQTHPAVLSAALVSASENNNPAAADLLLRYGADPASDGGLPARIALARGFQPVLAVLEKWGCDVVGIVTGCGKDLSGTDAMEGPVIGGMDARRFAPMPPARGLGGKGINFWVP
ncbi:hypothetical protein HKX48_004376 [Thoreauomyces humboldtii]|nr:hypothetical protein HKX48_004376 [Thoreauomyces humboldtii]